jgi:hypothetical protein
MVVMFMSYGCHVYVLVLSCLCIRVVMFMY